MTGFIISGTFKAGSNWKRFTKTVSSQNEKNAIEKVYSLIGSENKLKRNFIEITSTAETRA
ncbi:MAG: 50S ribosomal protein L18a [Methanosarcinales archaeon]|nr:50S ribosomal protein L18a [Methanosarcinales archaeon]MCK4652414.1 50S ribosomal protein L18a [Methanosarcinales archaeon]